MIPCEVCSLPASLVVMTSTPNLEDPVSTSTLALCPIHSITWMKDCIAAVDSIGPRVQRLLTVGSCLGECQVCGTACTGPAPTVTK